jgi:hypothetical protein
VAFLGTRTSSRQPNGRAAGTGLTRDFGQQDKAGLNQLVASLSFNSGTGQIAGANGTFSNFGAVGDRIQVEGTSLVNDGAFQVTAIDATNHAFVTVVPAPKTQGAVTATLRKLIS